MNVRLRRGRKDDVAAIIELYKAVGAKLGGIARRSHEVTTEYVTAFVEDSLERGIIVVAEFVDGSHSEPLTSHPERGEGSALVRSEESAGGHSERSEESALRLAGELHAYRSELHVLKHVMGDLTIAVHPDAQGQGVGRKLFVELLDEVKAKHPDITRVELVTQESNVRALRLYESLGFEREGYLPGRILGPNGIEGDIPMAWLRNR